MKNSWKRKHFTEFKFRTNQVIVGTLNPIKWDQKGRVQKYSIYTPYDEDIIIEDYRNRSRLKSLLNKKVEAYGLIRHNFKGEKFISLKKIKEIGGSNTPAPTQLKSKHAEFITEEFSLNIPNDVYSPISLQFNDPFWEAC